VYSERKSRASNNRLSCYNSRDNNGEQESAKRRGSGNIVCMSACQAFCLIMKGDKGALRYGLNEGRIINGQKVFVQVISGTALFARIVGMDQLFCHLVAEQPGNSLLQR